MPKQKKTEPVPSVEECLFRSMNGRFGNREDTFDYPEYWMAMSSRVVGYASEREIAVVALGWWKWTVDRVLGNNADISQFAAWKHWRQKYGI